MLALNVTNARNAAITMNDSVRWRCDIFVRRMNIRQILRNEFVDGLRLHFISAIVRRIGSPIIDAFRRTLSRFRSGRGWRDRRGTGRCIGWSE